jgi:hypothetical protein
LFVELVEHLTEENLHVEMALDSVDYVNLVEVSLLVEPPVCNMALEYNRDGELPDFDVISNEVQHCT